MCLRLQITCAMVALIQLPVFLTPLGAQTLSFSGEINTVGGEPIVGATVRLLSDGVTLTAVACDAEGRFRLGWKAGPDQTAAAIPDVLSLEVSCVGFTPTKVKLSGEAQSRALRITLEETSAQLEGVTAVAPPTAHSAGAATSGKRLIELSNRSFAPSNPLEAVRGGAVSRSGSSLGSQIRFAGSSPVYTLNGATLGTDPAHYGMFSLLPTEALDRLSYSDHATSARGGSPTKVELYTDRSFRDASEARITLSALEAVGGARRGNGRFFIAGSVRGSILDKLVERLSDTTAPVRIPPTEFRDLFVNAGIRLSGSLELFVDQYVTSDGLTLTTGATSLNGDGIRASQNTGRSLLNLELRKLTPGLWWKVAAQAERVTADYRAQVAGEAGPAALALDLSERRRRFQLSGEITRMWKTLRIAAGAQGVWREYPSTYLRQQNWNFLPPQATSDNPNFYQLGLNLLYSEFDVAASGGELALYAEIEKELPRWTLRAGARAQMYGYLAHRYDVVGRLSVSHKLNRYAGLKVGYGSYAESPLGNLIDPYQTLIRRQLAELNSLKTNLITIAYERNYRERSVFGAKLFAKRITDLPALTPIIRTYEAFGLALNALGDLRMRSSRSQDYVGGALSYRRRRALEGLFGDRLDFSFSYALTMARESVRGISASPTENAPHQLETGLDYRAGKLWSLGARLSARSGYRYTSPRDFDLSPSGLLQTYTGELDGESIASENNARFPAHASLQISARYEREVFSLFASVGNLLNRSNPIISARDGFIYDSGILPSIGASWRF